MLEKVMIMLILLYLDVATCRHTQRTMINMNTRTRKEPQQNQQNPEYDLLM